jgi:histidinol-phosphate aminotransferase
VTDICDLAPGYIRAIAPYQPGKPISELARELGLEEAGIIKLASNENPGGVSPLAQRAIERTLADLARYPDGNGFELKQAFAVYPLVVQAIGAKGIEVAARDYGHDPDAMLSAVTDRTRVVFVANPNNPTGTLIAPQVLERFIDSLPREVVLVLDEAYNEYLPEALKSDTIGWLARFPNLVVTRTFSKVYGLAGLRVGYAFAAPAVADLMNRVRQPFNVNSISLAAATAALDDVAFVKKSVELNRTGMQQLTRGFERLGVAFIPSVGNFVSFEVPDAAAVYRRLLELGVIVRPIAAYKLPKHLRVTVGLESENTRFLDALGRALRGE